MHLVAALFTVIGGITLRSCAAGGVFLSNFCAQSPPVPSPDWLLWQLADSAFPTGGFAHSNGIEAAYQHRQLPTPAHVADFTATALHQIVHASAPFLLAACDPTSNLLELDALLATTLPSHVANRASWLQGQALLSTAQHVYRHQPLTDFREQVLLNQTPGHLPIIFGLLAQTLCIPRESALRLYLFISMRGILSAAVRLGAVGPLEAQHIQSTLTPTLEGLTQEALSLTLDDVAQTAPLIELWQGTQDRLYSRLFQS